MAELIAGFYGRAIPLHMSGDLLDLGCGKAPLLEWYSQFVSSVTLVDWEHSPHSPSLLDVTQDLSEDLRFDGELFDSVILSDVLEHIYQPSHLLNEIYRVLRPAGNLVLNVPFSYWIHEEPYDYYRYTRFALIRMLEVSGFNVLHIEPLGGLLETLTDHVAKVSASTGRAGASLSVALQLLSLRTLRTSAGARLYAKTSSKWPLAYGVVATKNA